MKYISTIVLSILALLLFSFSTTVLYAQNAKDITEPSDVENLKAVPGDGEIQLTWDAADDNVGVTGYKIYRGTRSVRATEDHRYDLPIIPVSNVTSYVVKNLTNGNTYYFSVTAVDAAGNESVNYSLEASSTPQSGLHLASVEDDGKSPQVKTVESEDVITVKVVFSEPVKLPLEQPESAFTVEKTSDKSRLKVQQATVDDRNATGKTILLTTEPQEENAEYVLTAGLEIQDFYNNPVVSGTSDTGSFKGSAKKKAPPPPAQTKAPSPDETPPADETPLTIVGGTADFNNRISVNFSKQVAPPANAVEQFKIFKKDTQEQLTVINASLSVDGKTVYLTTDPQRGTEYEVQISGIKDLAGNILADSTVTVTGRGSSLEDMIAPENVTQLIAKLKSSQDKLVELRWKASKNSAGDLADQLLYQGEGKAAKTFGKGASLGSTTTAVEVQDLAGGKWYTFKVTTKDTSTNESKGTAVSLYLPETGPGIVAAGLTALAMGLYRKKRANSKGQK